MYVEGVEGRIQFDPRKPQEAAVSFTPVLCLETGSCYVALDDLELNI